MKYKKINDLVSAFYDKKQISEVGGVYFNTKVIYAGLCIMDFMVSHRLNGLQFYYETDRDDNKYCDAISIDEYNKFIDFMNLNYELAKKDDEVKKKKTKI